MRITRIEMQPTKPNPQPTFGYHTHLKDCWMAGKLPTVKKGLYGFPLTKKTVSNEHIIPYSKCHNSKEENIALANKYINNLRGDKPIQEFLTKNQLINYLIQFMGIKVKHKGKVFDGDRYIAGVLNTTKDLDLK